MGSRNRSFRIEDDPMGDNFRQSLEDIRVGFRDSAPKVMLISSLKLGFVTVESLDTLSFTSDLSYRRADKRRRRTTNTLKPPLPIYLKNLNETEPSLGQIIARNWANFSLPLPILSPILY